MFASDHAVFDRIKISSVFRGFLDNFVVETLQWPSYHLSNERLKIVARVARVKNATGPSEKMSNEISRRSDDSFDAFCANDIHSIRGQRMSCIAELQNDGGKSGKM